MGQSSGLFRRRVDQHCCVLVAVVAIVVIMIVGVFQLFVAMFVSVFAHHYLGVAVSMVAVIVTVGVGVGHVMVNMSVIG